MQDLTDDDSAVSLDNKLVGQVNLVQLGSRYINDQRSFTLTSGSSRCAQHGIIEPYRQVAPPFACPMAVKNRINKPPVVFGGGPHHLVTTRQQIPYPVPLTVW